MLTLTAALAVAGMIGWTALRIGAVEARLAGLESGVAEVARVTHLIRLEGKSQGRGIGAILEQIDFWAPQLATAATPQPAAVKIEAALDECLTAVEALGRDAFPTLVAALESDSSRDDEARKWILRGAYRADPTEGRALLASVLRGTRLAPSPRLRFFAADELLRVDKALAGDVLSQVLQVESAAGVTRQVPPGLAPEYERVIGTNVFPEFFNLIARFVQSGHPDVERVLLMILGRPEHDRMTYQECIRSLGQLRSRDAVPRIKEFYATPPRNEFNPLFMNICLQAIADVQGSEACAWFREQLRAATNQIVMTKLQDLLKQHCGGQ